MGKKFSWIFQGEMPRCALHGDVARVATKPPCCNFYFLIASRIHRNRTRNSRGTLRQVKRSSLSNSNSTRNNSKNSAISGFKILPSKCLFPNSVTSQIQGLGSLTLTLTLETLHHVTRRVQTASCVPLTQSIFDRDFNKVLKQRDISTEHKMKHSSYKAQFSFVTALYC